MYHPFLLSSVFQRCWSVRAAERGTELRPQKCWFLHFYVLKSVALAGYGVDMGSAGKCLRGVTFFWLWVRSRGASRRCLILSFPRRASAAQRSPLVEGRRMYHPPLLSS